MTRTALQTRILENLRKTTRTAPVAATKTEKKRSVSFYA